jgi:hypothetical protein
MLGAMPILPQYVFMAWYIVKYKENVPLLYLDLELSVKYELY